MKRWRMFTTMALLATAIAAVLWIPLPSHVYSSLEVQARGAANVYVTTPGVLEAVYVQPGDYVEEGKVLAELRDINTETLYEKLLGERDMYKSQLTALDNISIRQQGTAGRITQVTKALASTEEQLAKAERDLRELRLVAPRSGTVLPPTLVPAQKHDDTQLPTWSGSPLQKENLGAVLMKGTKLCQIGNPKWLEARLVIDQGDVEFIAPGQKVEVILDQSADVVYVSHIENVSTEDLKASPMRLSSLHGGSLPTKMDDSGTPRPIGRVYEAVVPLPEDANDMLRIGLVGEAKITTAPRTLGSRLYRYLSRTFNFEL